MFVLEKYGQQKKNILRKLWETKKKYKQKGLKKFATQ
jgi:hypothetical protein